MIWNGEQAGRGRVIDECLAARLTDLQAVVPNARPRSTHETLRRQKAETRFVGSFIDRDPGEKFPADPAMRAAIPQPVAPFKTELQVSVTVGRFESLRLHCQHLVASLIRRRPISPAHAPR